MKVCTILSTDRYPERNADQLLLVRVLMLAEATVTQTSMLSIRMHMIVQANRMGSWPPLMGSVDHQSVRAENVPGAMY